MRKYDSKSRLALTTEDGKPIARISTDSEGMRFALKRIEASKHFLRTPPAIGFDVSAIEQARKLKLAYFLVQDKESGETYKASLEDFDRHSIPVHRWKAPQRALPLAFWRKGSDPEQHVLYLFAEGKEAA